MEASTSLIGVLTRLFYLFSTYVELYRTSTILGGSENLSLRQDSDSFLAHHGGRRLWSLPSPVVRRNPNQAHRRHPHTMGDAACTLLGINPLGGRVVSTTTKIVNVSFCLSIVNMRVVDGPPHLPCCSPYFARHHPPAAIQ